MGPHTRGVSGAGSLGRLQPSLVGLEADGLAYVTCSVALTFILTFQTNLKLLVHPWQMSQRVHADTEHRRGENLKRKENNIKEKQNNKQKNKTQKWHYSSPMSPSPPTAHPVGGGGSGRAAGANTEKQHLPVARKRCMARRSWGDILTFISLSVCLKAEKSCFLSRWATFFFVLLSAAEQRRMELRPESQN